MSSSAIGAVIGALQPWATDLVTGQTVYMTRKNVGGFSGVAPTLRLLWIGFSKASNLRMGKVIIAYGE